MTAHMKTHNNAAAERLELVDGDIVLITDYLADGLSEEDRAIVERRLVNEPAFFNKVWPMMDLWMAPIDTTEMVAAVVARGENAEPALETDTTSPKRKRGRFFWTKVGVVALAAGIAIMAYIGPPTLYEPHPMSGFYQTAATERRDVMLPDRSRVHLGPSGAVIWDANVTNGRITVYLYGNATFEVVRGRHIAVWTPGGSATLQSGEFAVAYDGKANAMSVAARRGEAVLIDHSANPVRQAIKSGDSGSVTTGNQAHGRVDSPVPDSLEDDSNAVKLLRPRVAAPSQLGSAPGDDQ